MKINSNVLIKKKISYLSQQIIYLFIYLFIYLGRKGGADVGFPFVSSEYAAANGERCDVAT